MSETKKKTNPNTGKGRTASGSKAGSGAQPGNARTGANRTSASKTGANKSGGKVTVQKESANHSEITAIVIIACCVFAFICLLGKAGPLGKFVCSVFCGLIGYVGSAIAIITAFVAAIAILRGTLSQVMTKTRVAVIICLTIFLTALLHTFSGAYDPALFKSGSQIMSAVKSLWSAYSEYSLAGGLLGGGLSSLLITFTTEVGAFVILVPGTLVFAMLLFKFSLLPFFEKVSVIAKKVGAGIASFWKRLTAKNPSGKEKTPKIKTTANSAYGGSDVDASIDEAESEQNAKDGEVTFTDLNLTVTQETETPKNEPPEPVIFVFDEIPIPDPEEDENGLDQSELPPVDITIEVPDENLEVTGASAITAETGNRRAAASGYVRQPGARPSFTTLGNRPQQYEKPYESNVPVPSSEWPFKEDEKTPAAEPTSAADYGNESDYSQMPLEPVAAGEDKAENSRPPMNSNPGGYTGTVPQRSKPVSNGTETGTRAEPPAESSSRPPVNAQETVNVDKAQKAGASLPVLSDGQYENYRYPSINLLKYDINAKRQAAAASKSECDATAKKLEETLANFGVEAHVTNAYIGPTVTRYELTPKIGTRMEAFKRLADEIAFYLAAESIRIEAPIPGKSAVGIEVPNKQRNTVYLREVIQSEKFTQSKSKLTCAIGADIQNAPVVCDIAKLPHLLIGGTTGSGKSVCTNGIIMSLLYKATPDELRLILIDPKMVEFDKYNGIPHLLLPVVTDAKKAASALSWAVLEMDKRYAYFAEHHVSNLQAYNDYALKEDLPQMPRIVIIIDELADLMMVAKQNVELAINRIAQKARACGMHLIVATQSPRVDVVTGLIKANIGSRIGLSVSNGTDSRIILDALGAEKLLGRGDMIYAPITESKQIRVQGAFASDDEIKAVVDAISDKKHGDNYIPEVMESIENAGNEEESGDKGDKNSQKESDKADLYEQAVQLAMEAGEISTSYIQRRLGVGYNRAADIMDKMVEDGIIERGVGSKKSKVIKRI